MKAMSPNSQLQHTHITRHEQTRCPANGFTSDMLTGSCCRSPHITTCWRQPESSYDIIIDTHGNSHDKSSCFFSPRNLVKLHVLLRECPSVRPIVYLSRFSISKYALYHRTMSLVSWGPILNFWVYGIHTSERVKERHPRLYDKENCLENCHISETVRHST